MNFTIQFVYIIFHIKFYFPNMSKVIIIGSLSVCYSVNRIILLYFVRFNRGINLDVYIEYLFC